MQTWYLYESPLGYRYWEMLGPSIIADRVVRTAESDGTPDQDPYSDQATFALIPGIL